METTYEYDDNDPSAHDAPEFNITRKREGGQDIIRSESGPHVVFDTSFVTSMNIMFCDCTFLET